MSTRQLGTRTRPAASLVSQQHIPVSEKATSQLTSRGALTPAEFGVSPLPPSAHATALSRSSGGQLFRAGHALLQLQRRHGNRYVQQIIGHAWRAVNSAAPITRAMPAVGPTDERDADQVADLVMRRTAPRLSDASDVRADLEGPFALPRRNTAAGDVVEGPVAQAIRQACVGGRAVPGMLRERMEQALGADFGGIRIHTDARSDRLNEALQSRAFTVGADVFIRRRDYRPGSNDGAALLAHELTHTVQQGAVRVPGRAAFPARPAPSGGGLAMARPLVVQRKLIRIGAPKTKPTTVAWTDVKSESAVQKAEEVIALVICDVAASSAINLKFTDTVDLVQQAATLASKPSEKLISEVTWHTLGLLRAHWRSLGVGYQGFQKQISERETQSDLRRIEVPGAPQIHTPLHDPGYKLTKGWENKPADKKGRKDAKWRPIKNTSGMIPAAKTGSTNLTLMEEQEKIGNVEKIGDFYVQICSGCGNAEFADNYEVDHQYAFSAIRNQLFRLAWRMNSKPGVEKDVRKQFGSKLFDTYFTKSDVGTKKKPEIIFTPSKAAMNKFSNDLGNLMRICRKCNGATGKSDLHYLEWYLRNDLFGPAFVRENLIDDSGLLLPRAKGGRGWGEAARAWFEQKHLPMLKNLFPARRLQEVTRSDLVRVSSTRVRAASESNASRKRKLEAESEQLDLRLKKTVGMTEVTIAAHTRPDQPLIRPGSPERDVDEHAKLEVSLVEGRKRRRTGETLSYKDGYKDGYSGTPNRSKAYPVGVERTAYQQGHTAGTDTAKAETEQGYADAVTGIPSNSGSTPYGAGYQKGVKKLDAVRKKGELDSKSGAPPSATIVDPKEVGAAYLFTVYLQGYRKNFGS